MSKSLRLSEKWFRRGLWLVALVFASFLIGLGGTIVGDLPKVETPLRVDDFLDKTAADKLRAEVKAARQAEQDAQTALEQAQLQRSKVRSEVQAERDSFNNWLSTRSATQRADQDPEVLARTQALDVLKLAERKTQQAVEAQQQAALDARQAAAARQEQLSRMESDGYVKLNAEFHVLLSRMVGSDVIARELDISVKTVDVHRTKIKEKMGVSSIAMLVRDARVVAACFLLAFIGWALRQIYLHDDGRFTVRFEPAPAAIASPDLVVATTAMNAAVEAVARRDLRQYQWTYKRYTLRPPGSGEPNPYQRPRKEPG